MNEKLNELIAQARAAGKDEDYVQQLADAYKAKFPDEDTTVPPIDETAEVQPQLEGPSDTKDFSKVQPTGIHDPVQNYLVGGELGDIIQQAQQAGKGKEYISELTTAYYDKYPELKPYWGDKAVYDDDGELSAVGGDFGQFMTDNGGWVWDTIEDLSIRALDTGLLMREVAAAGGDVALDDTPSPEEIKRFQDSLKALQSDAMTKESLDFGRCVQESGDTYLSAIGCLSKNPTVALSSLVSSFVGSFNKYSAGAAATAYAGRSAAGAGYGAVTGASAGGVGAAPGAVAGFLAAQPWAIKHAWSAGGSVMDGLVSLPDYLKEELEKEGIEPTDENVEKALTERRDLVQLALNRSKKRALSIHGFNIATTSLAGTLISKSAKNISKLRPRLQTAAKLGLRSGVELPGEALGELTAQVAADEDISPSEVVLEAFGGLGDVTVSSITDQFNIPQYSIGGDVNQSENDVINYAKRATFEELKKNPINIKNNPGLERQITNIQLIRKQREEIDNNDSFNLSDEDTLKAVKLQYETSVLKAGLETEFSKSNINRIKHNLDYLSKKARGEKLTEEDRPEPYKINKDVDNFVNDVFSFGNKTYKGKNPETKTSDDKDTVDTKEQKAPSSAPVKGTSVKPTPVTKPTPAKKVKTPNSQIKNLGKRISPIVGDKDNELNLEGVDNVDDPLGFLNEEDKGNFKDSGADYTSTLQRKIKTNESHLKPKSLSKASPKIKRTSDTGTGALKGYKLDTKTNERQIQLGDTVVEGHSQAAKDINEAIQRYLETYNNGIGIVLYDGDNLGSSGVSKTADNDNVGIVRLNANALSLENVHHELGGHVRKALLKKHNIALSDALDKTFRNTPLEQEARKMIVKAGYDKSNLNAAGIADEKMQYVIGKLLSGDKEFIEAAIKNSEDKKAARSLVERLIEYVKSLFGYGEQTSDAFIGELGKAEAYTANNDFTKEEIAAAIADTNPGLFKSGKEAEILLQKFLDENVQDEYSLEVEKTVVDNAADAHKKLTKEDFQDDKVYFGYTGEPAYKLVKDLLRIASEFKSEFAQSSDEKYRTTVAKAWFLKNRPVLDATKTPKVFQKKDGTTGVGVYGPGDWFKAGASLLDKLKNDGYVKDIIANDDTTRVASDAQSELQWKKAERVREKIADKLYKQDIDNRDLIIKSAKEAVNKAFEEEGRVVTEQLQAQIDAVKAYEKSKTPKVDMYDLEDEDISALNVISKDPKLQHLTALDKKTLAKTEVLEKNSAKAKAEALSRLVEWGKSSLGPRKGVDNNKFKNLSYKKLAESIQRALIGIVSNDSPLHTMAVAAAVRYVASTHEDVTQGKKISDLSDAKQEEIYMASGNWVIGAIDAYAIDGIDGAFDLHKNPDPEENSNLMYVNNMAKATALIGDMTQSDLGFTEEKPGKKISLSKDGGVSQQAKNANKPKNAPKLADVLEMQESVPLGKDLGDVLALTDFVKNGTHEEYDIRESSAYLEQKQLEKEFEKEKANPDRTPESLANVKDRLEDAKRRVRNRDTKINSELTNSAILADDVDLLKRYYLEHLVQVPGRFGTVSSLFTFQASKLLIVGNTFMEDDHYTIPVANSQTVDDNLINIGYVFGGKATTTDELAKKWAIMHYSELADAYANPAQSELLNKAKEAELGLMAVRNFGKMFVDQDGLNKKLSLSYEIDTSSSGIVVGGLVTKDLGALHWGNMLEKDVKRDAYVELPLTWIKNNQRLYKKSSETSFPSDFIDSKEAYDHSIKLMEELEEHGRLALTEQEEAELKELTSKYFAGTQTKDDKKRSFELKEKKDKEDKRWDELRNNNTADHRLMTGIMQMPEFVSKLRKIFKTPIMTVLYAIGDEGLSKKLRADIAEQFKPLGGQAQRLAELEWIGDANRTTEPTAEEQAEYESLSTRAMTASILQSDYFGTYFAKGVREIFAEELPGLFDYLNTIKEFATEFYANSDPDHYEYDADGPKFFLDDEGNHKFLEIKDPFTDYINVHEKYFPKTYKFRGNYTGSNLGNVSKRARAETALRSGDRDYGKEAVALASAIIHGGDKAIIARMTQILYAKGIHATYNHDGIFSIAGFRNELIDAYNQAAQELFDSDYLLNFFEQNTPKDSKKTPQEWYNQIISPDKALPQLVSYSTGYGEGITGSKENLKFIKDSDKFFANNEALNIKDGKKLAEEMKKRITEACKL